MSEETPERAPAPSVEHQMLAALLRIEKHLSSIERTTSWVERRLEAQDRARRDMVDMAARWRNP